MVGGVSEFEAGVLQTSNFDHTLTPTSNVHIEQIREAVDFLRGPILNFVYSVHSSGAKGNDVPPVCPFHLRHSAASIKLAITMKPQLDDNGSFH